MVVQPDSDQKLFLAADGNFSLCHFANAGTASHRPFLHPVYFLPDADRDAFQEDEEEAGACQMRFRAERASSSSSAAKDIDGVLATCCRHDTPLHLCNIPERSGERFSYVRFLLSKARGIYGPRQRIALCYDLGCKMQSDDMTQVFVPAFHVLAHEAKCQATRGVRASGGATLWEGEGVERFWAQMNAFMNTRSMSLEARADMLNFIMERQIERRNGGLAKFLKRKLVFARKALEGATKSLDCAMQLKPSIPIT